MAKILLIEDDFFINDIYGRALTKAGFEVKAVLSGDEGIKAARENQFDLVLLDIMMPGKTGLEVLKELRLISATLPIVLFTNLAQISVIQEALRLGATGYLLKGGKSPNQVIERLTKFLETKDPSLFETL